MCNTNCSAKFGGCHKFHPICEVLGICISPIDLRCFGHRAPFEPGSAGLRSLGEGVSEDPWMVKVSSQSLITGTSLEHHWTSLEQGFV